MTMIADSPRVRLAEEFDLMLANGFDVNDILLAVGKSYDTVLRSIQRAGRDDLVATMRAWKSEDADRLARARGLIWA